MLNRIPSAINNVSRNIVINHPNSYNAVIARKTVNRTAATEVGGLPTLGNLAVLSSEDEGDLSWSVLGNAFALEAEANPFEPSMMSDRQDATQGSLQEFKFLIEPEVKDAFKIKKNDVLYLVLGAIRLAYEIVLIETTSNIPPYTQRYICQISDDLHLVI